MLLIAYKLRNFIRDVKHVVCTLNVIKNNLSLIAISQTKFFFFDSNNFLITSDDEFKNKFLIKITYILHIIEQFVPLKLIM